MPSFGSRSIGVGVITLDTSALLTLFNSRDPDHEAVRDAVVADPGPRLLPAGILGELTYLIDERFGVDALDRFLVDVERGVYTVDCGENDFPRIRDLVGRYADLPLGFADASVIACAERSGGKVVALDRDFVVVSGEGRIQVLPTND